MHLNQDLGWAIATIELPGDSRIVSLLEEEDSLHVPHDVGTKDLLDLDTAMTLIQVLCDFGVIQHLNRPSTESTQRRTRA